jgi:hypothetical protein
VPFSTMPDDEAQDKSIIHLANSPCSNKSHNAISPGNGTHNATWVAMMTMHGDGDGTHKAAWEAMMSMPGHDDGILPDDGTNKIDDVDNKVCKWPRNPLPTLGLDTRTPFVPKALHHGCPRHSSYYCGSSRFQHLKHHCDVTSHPSLQSGCCC